MNNSGRDAHGIGVETIEDAGAGAIRPVTRAAAAQVLASPAVEEVRAPHRAIGWRANDSKKDFARWASMGC
jgi:hypothetical protein